MADNFEYEILILVQSKEAYVPTEGCRNQGEKGSIELGKIKITDCGYKVRLW